MLNLERRASESEAVGRCEWRAAAVHMARFQEAQWLMFVVECSLKMAYGENKSKPQPRRHG